MVATPVASGRMASRSSAARLVEKDPHQAAAAVIRASAQRPEWIEAFAEAVVAGAATDGLRRFLLAWGLSQAEAARIFGVSRQAVAKWLALGVPAERRRAVADLVAATDILLDHLKVDRVAAVVRRPAERLGGRSLLELASSGDTEAVAAACSAMFDLSAVVG
jgi:predicted transcriptional regulator